MHSARCREFDRVVARIRNVIHRRAPRAYELILLSDHGQSFGATFKQRYGQDLKQFIEQFLPQGTSIAQSLGGDDGALSVGALGNELGNVRAQPGVGNRVGRAVIRRGERLASRGQHELGDSIAAAEAATVTVCASGNLAQVYFDLAPRKLSLGELEFAFPGMVAALVAHPGIGFLVGYEEDGAPMVLGKGGTRNLQTGVISGHRSPAPLCCTGIATVELRAAQVRRIADFPNAGDLIVNSTFFPDGTVAAMEELVGSHGGLGRRADRCVLAAPGGSAAASHAERG